MCEDIFWETNPDNLKSNLKLWEYFWNISPDFFLSAAPNPEKISLLTVQNLNFVESPHLVLNLNPSNPPNPPSDFSEPRFTPNLVAIQIPNLPLEINSNSSSNPPDIAAPPNPSQPSQNPIKKNPLPWG